MSDHPAGGDPTYRPVPKREYDSTLVRVAGNIASGLVPPFPHVLSEAEMNLIAVTAATLTEKIVAQFKVAPR